jgi:quinol monooxygenase YgiN
MSNIRKVVLIEAREGMAEILRAELIQLETATLREEGCNAFRFFQALTEPHSFLLVEDFRDAAALERHLGLPHTRAFFAKGLVAAISPIDPVTLG